MYERYRTTESSMPTRFRPPSASESCDWMSSRLGATGGGSGGTAGGGGGGALDTEIVRPVPAVGCASAVDAGDADHLEVGVQHVGVVPGRVLPGVEGGLSGVWARSQVLALPGVVA